MKKKPPKPPPKKPDPCPKGNGHSPKRVSEEKGWLVHKCAKCGEVFERQRDPMTSGMSAYLASRESGGKK